MIVLTRLLRRINKAHDSVKVVKRGSGVVMLWKQIKYQLHITICPDAS